MAPLEQLDTVDVEADLNQIAHHELRAAALGARRDLAAASHVRFGQDRRVKGPSAQDKKDKKCLLYRDHHRVRVFFRLNPWASGINVLQMETIHDYESIHIK